MFKYIIFCLPCLTLLSCKSNTNNNTLNVILHNDNHIPDRQANEYFEKGLKYVEEENYGEGRSTP